MKLISAKYGKSIYESLDVLNIIYDKLIIDGELRITVEDNFNNLFSDPYEGHYKYLILKMDNNKQYIIPEKGLFQNFFMRL